MCAEHISDNAATDEEDGISEEEVRARSRLIKVCKPIPDFEKLFQEADKRQEEALKTFRREVRRYNKIWRACGGDVKTYLEVVNSGG
mgnify:CR=1 FL=1